jgi:hypothetical protein
MQTFPFSVSLQIVSGDVEVGQRRATDKPEEKMLKTKHLIEEGAAEGFSYDPIEAEVRINLRPSCSARDPD